jgi:hypothetical protein
MARRFYFIGDRTRVRKINHRHEFKKDGGAGSATVFHLLEFDPSS